MTRDIRDVGARWVVWEKPKNLFLTDILLDCDVPSVATWNRVCASPGRDCPLKP